MAATVLVTDIETTIGYELAKLYLNGGRNVAATTSQANESGFREFSGKPFFPVEWRRGSALAARTVVLKTLNRFGSLDEVFVVHAPSIQRKLVHELSFADIEQAVDRFLKGGAFMVREALLCFLKQGHGVLAVVSHAPKESNQGVAALEAMVRDGLAGYVNALFSSYDEKDIHCNGFLSSARAADEFARFIAKTLDDKGRRISGRWFTHQARSGFLQGILPGMAWK